MNTDNQKPVVGESTKKLIPTTELQRRTWYVSTTTDVFRKEDTLKVYKTDYTESSLTGEVEPEG